MTEQLRPELRLVNGQRRPRRRGPDPRSSIAAQAVMAGPQDLRVRAATPSATGLGHGYVVLRVGRLLVYLEDRDALDTWREALRQAIELSDEAYGPELPPPSYRPRRS